MANQLFCASKTGRKRSPLLAASQLSRFYLRSSIPRPPANSTPQTQLKPVKIHHPNWIRVEVAIGLGQFGYWGGARRELLIRREHATNLSTDIWPQRNTATKEEAEIECYAHEN